MTPPPVVPTSTTGTPAPRWRSCLARGCLSTILLGGGCVAFSVWMINAPARHAEAFEPLVQPGMTLGQVATMPVLERHLKFVRQAEGAPRLTAGERATIGDQPATAAEIDRRGPELRVEAISFMFLGSAPTRSSIVVRFGPHGRVSAVEGPYHQAD